MSPNEKHGKTDGSNETLHSSLLLGEDGTTNSGLSRRETAITALLIIGWWGFSSIWNIGAKRVLSQADEGVTLTLMQHCIGAFMSGLWQYFFQGKNIRMLITKDTVVIAALYCVGTLALNISLITSSAAFTQNLKSIECILTGLLSRKYLKTRISRQVGFAMCLISIGAFLSSVSGVDQSFHGVLFVVISSFALSYRNVFTKKLYKTYGESIPDLDSTFFFEMSFMAACFLTPVWLAGTAFWKTSAADPWEICAVGMYHFLYNCLSFVVLSRVSTITHSVCNNVKRVFVVAVSLAYFQTNNTSPVNMIGLLLCSLGVLYYAHASATSKKKLVESGMTTGFFDSIQMPKVSLKSVLQFVFLGVLAMAMLFREGLGKSQPMSEPSSSLSLPPSVIRRSEGLEKLNLLAQSVNSTGIRIVMYTAAGNGNLGDNIQAMTNLDHFKRFGILKNKNIELWSSSIQSCCYTYPDVVHKFTLPARPTDEDIAWMNENFSVLWIGGGGLLGYPHPPLDLNFNNWMNRITFPVVFAGLGSSTGNEEKVFRAANMLLRKAVHVGVRTPEDAKELIDNGYENASYMPDPVLSDPTYTPPESAERDLIQTRWNSTRVCWIPKETYVAKITQVVRPSDIIFAFEGRDGNFNGRFPTIHRVLEDGHVFSKSLDHCDLVVTMRYHGAVLAIRRLIPTIMLGSMADSRSKHYQLATMMNLERCHIAMDTIPDAYTFQTRFHQMRLACLQSFDPIAVVGKLKEIEAQYESEFVTGLTKAFHALGLEDGQINTSVSQ